MINFFIKKIFRRNKIKLNIPKKTILIIDDEEKILEILEMILNSCNYKIIKANRGIEGLKLIKENFNIIDLILLDLMMPDIYGLNLLEEIKKNKNTKNIPVIIQSGLRDLSEIEKCFKLGIVSFLNKPYTKREVIEEVNKVFTSF